MSKIKKNKYRYHSPKYFVDMVEYFNKKYDQRYFVFGDNFFTLDQERTKLICDEIVKRKLDIEWICMTRTDSVSQSLLNKMRQAGCVEISFGAESCSEHVQKKIGKNLPKSSIRKAYSIELKTKRFWILLTDRPSFLQKQESTGARIEEITQKACWL